ncbi:hypothetical protein OAB56_02625 [Gammaproteobacteria bacterium]|jgi:hypothetical protein|nr:hypothetical protein [Gammaproteobacteria bacterium]|tara:strand:- start:1253 stop:1480 length:228 start_codon:yes stop_codon:yes gene_type:complete
MKALHFKRELETMNNRERLMEIMTEQDLDRLRLAELLKVKRAEVDNWLLSRESKNNKEIPDMAIELLEVKLDLKE